MKKKLVVFAVGKGISRIYGKVIKKSSAKELGSLTPLSLIQK